MKKIIIIISAFAIPITIIKTASAQSLLQTVEGTATIPEKETAEDKNLDLLIDVIKVDIAKCVDNISKYQKIASDRNEFSSYSDLTSRNLDEFNLDEFKNTFENAISLVDRHEKSLVNEYQTIKTTLDEFKKLASDISLSQREHDSYQKKIRTCESEIQKVNEYRVKLIRTWNDLHKTKKKIEYSLKPTFLDY
jgi:hypothetical protein